MAGYGTDQAFTDWLAENGYTLPDGSPSAAVLRNRGSVYIDGTYGPRFSGLPTNGYAQERAWPRTGAYAYGTAIGDSVIPDAVVKASYAAAWQEASSPGSLSVVVDPNKRIKRQRVEGAVEREFFEPGSDSVAAPTSTAIEGLLAPYLVGVKEPGILVV